MNLENIYGSIQKELKLVEQRLEQLTKGNGRQGLSNTHIYIESS